MALDQQRTLLFILLVLVLPGKLTSIDSDLTATSAVGSCDVDSDVSLQQHEAEAMDLGMMLLQDDRGRISKRLLQRGRNASEGLARCEGFECLKSYVDAPDAAFSWHDTGDRMDGTSSSGVKWTGYVLELTSQAWLTEADVNRPTWKHRLVVIVPSNLESATSPAAGWCTLYLALDSVVSPMAGSKDPDVRVAAEMAALTGSLTAILLDVPAADLVFDNDPKQKSRSEDELAAYSWSAFADDPSRPEMLVELPMAKATVRAMDAISLFAAQTLHHNGSLGRFALMGSSKRAATAWHAAAVDDRVGAVVSISKAFNVSGFIHESYKSLGGIPVSGSDYNTYVFNKGLFDDGNAAGEKLSAIIEPTAYAEKIGARDSLIVSGTSDEFFPPDHTRLWLEKIPGRKAHLMLPNVGHVIGEEILDFAKPIGAYLRGVFTESERPELSWTIDRPSGAITVRQAVGSPPVKVELWRAQTCDGRRRDFRKHNNDRGADCAACGVDHSGLFGPMEDPLSVAFGHCENTAVTWSSTELPSKHPGIWVAEVEAPQTGGWAAFFVSFEFDGPSPVHDDSVENYVMTTEVSVVPDTYPFEDCTNCTGKELVLLGLSVNRSAS